MTVLQGRSMGLYQHLELASTIRFKEGRLSIRFPASERFHARQVKESENQETLLQIVLGIMGKEVPIDVDLEGEQENETERKDPMADPKVKTFLDRFPGKVIVNRESDE